MHRSTGELADLLRVRRITAWENLSRYERMGLVRGDRRSQPIIWARTAKGRKAMRLISSLDKLLSAEGIQDEDKFGRGQMEALSA
jgi:hypothetical protein